MDSGLPETTLDASLVSAVIDGTERIITPVSPPAVMILKNMLPMEPGDHTYVLEDWPRNFYDDGGPDNPYKQYFSGTAHFVPGVPGKKCVLTSLNWHSTLHNRQSQPETPIKSRCITVWIPQPPI